MPDLPMTYRLEQRMVESERDLERSMEFFVDRTREEVVPPSLSRGPSFLSSERDEFPSTSRSVASCRDVDGDREPDDESDSSSLSWLQICKKSTEDNPVICNLSGSSDYPSSSDGRFFAPSERQHNRQSVSGSRSYDEPSPSKPMHRDDPSQPQYTPELAAVLLQGFGLEKEDLEYLLTFPEDQINSENLAVILKQIRLMKEKRTSTQSYSDPQPSTSFRGPDTPSSSRGPEMDQDDIATRILKPAKVIDYGHSGSYTVVGREMGNSSKITNDCTGSMRGTYSSSSYKEPLKPSTLGVKSSSAVPLYGVTISPTNFTSMRTSVTPQSSDQPKLPPTQPVQASQEIDIPFISPMKDIDPPNEPVSHQTQAPEKTIPTFVPPKTQADPPKHLQSRPIQAPVFTNFVLSNTVTRKRPKFSTMNLLKDPNQPGEVQDTKISKPSSAPLGEGGKVGCKQGSFTDYPSRTQKQHPEADKEQEIGKPAKEQKTMSQQSKAATAPMKQQPKEQTKLPEEARQHFPSSAQQTASRSFVPRSLAAPPVQTNTEAKKHHSSVKSDSSSSASKMKVFKGQPLRSMINDYKAAEPPAFPHRCTLCDKKCTAMKDWIYHYNTSLHLQNCKLLQKQYPDWEGEVQDWRVSDKQSVSQQRSRSRSHSSHHRQRDRSSSSSRSRSRSRSSQRNRRKERYSNSSSRSHSRSPHRHHDCKRKKEKHSSHRSRSRSSSPRHKSRSSHYYHSRSRSRERESRKKRERQSPSERSPKRRRSTSAERLAKRLLEASGVQSLSTQSDLEAVVKSMTPALLAELTKVKTASSQSSRPVLHDTKDEPLSPNLVKLRGIYSIISYTDLWNALESFGKIESLVLYRSRQEANILFQKVEGAEKLRSTKSFQVKGHTISVISESCVFVLPGSTSTKEQKKPPQSRSIQPADSSSSPGDKATTTGTSGRTKISSLKAETSSAAEKPGAKESVAAEEEALEPEEKTQGENMETQSSAEGKAGKPAEPGESPPSSTAETPAEKHSSQLQSDLEQEAEDSWSDDESDEKTGSEPVSPGSTPSGNVTPTADRTTPLMDDYHLNPETSLTVGDQLKSLLFKECFRCYTNKKKKCFKGRLPVKLFLISDLPDYEVCSYTEEELADLLVPFGFKHEVDTIYCIPQTGLALAIMPRRKDLQNLLRHMWDGVAFKGQELCIRPVSNSIPMTPFQFYTALMKLIHYEVTDDGSRTVFFQDISPSEIQELREVLIKSSVKNFLPMLNKVFVEFESNHDVDVFGLSQSSLKGHTYKLHRMRAPVTPSKSHVRDNLPPNTERPFWITMKTDPYIFPTVTPWFKIPNYIKINKVLEFTQADCQGSKFFTIMLTNLPKDNYTNEDVASLVWPYFPAKTLTALFSNVLVLPLQRRAFVYFSHWLSFISFVKDLPYKELIINSCQLKASLVLHMENHGLSQEKLYKNLLKLSNYPVPDSDSLVERLLSVEIFDASPHIVTLVMKVVASIASFANFVPLGNRIYIEMADSQAVAQVMEKVFFLDDLTEDKNWTKVGRIEP
ncbi:hypothetical protein ILYODFUR_008766 [Ilyodon furcidens]|uniref:Matrin-type domain-containing protein n=1 Tax=Ilyodon furcidens TaxID=33524 RepID=A0ABV0UIL8_9TELE